MQKIRFILFFIISVTLQAHAGQKYTAMLLDLNGQGVVKRQNKDSVLVLPIRFMEGDIVSLQEGNALVLLFSGKEITIQAGTDFAIPKEQSEGDSQLSILANAKKSDQSVFAQSGRAYSIRGRNLVFPLRSKILHLENLVLRLRTDTLLTNFNIKLIDELTQKVIFEKHKLSDSYVSLVDAALVPGKMYYWQIDTPNHAKPVMGTIVMPDHSEIATLLDLGMPKTHLQYLNAISSYYNKHFYFEVYSAICKAKKAFPEIAIYKVLLDNLLLE